MSLPKSWLATRVIHSVPERWLAQSIRDFQRVRVLQHSAIAEAQFQEWRSQKIRVATHDLRIATICVAEGAKLVSRNRRDFEAIPGLQVEFW